MSRRAAILASALTLSACATYAPSPPHPEAYPQRFDAARLETRPVWSGADLLAAALARNPRVAEARARYRAALAAVAVARQASPTTLTLTGEYANERPHWGYGAVAEIPLDLGARRRGRITTADLSALQTFYDLGEAVWTVEAALERARADLLAADAEITLADSVAMLRRERWMRLERRVVAGEDARSVSLIALTERAAADRRAAEARVRREQGVQALAAALGLPPAAVRDIVLAPAAAPELAGLADWRRDAAISRRDVLRAVVDYDLAENALRTEVARQYPEVRIGPGYNYDHGVTKLPISVGLTLPPYDLNRSGIAEAEARRAAAGRALEAVQAGALADVDKAAVALAAARANVLRLRGEDIVVADRAAASVSRAVRAGEADRTDDLASRAVAAEARLSLLEADHAQALAVADLAFALRRPFEAAEAAVLAEALRQDKGTP